MCRKAPAITTELGGEVPDMVTTGTQMSLSSALAVRDMARGCKAKRCKSGWGKSGTRSFSKPSCLTTGEPSAGQALRTLLYGISPEAPSVSNRVIKIKPPGGSQMHRLSQVPIVHRSALQRALVTKGFTHLQSQIYKPNLLLVSLAVQKDHTPQSKAV